MRVLLAAILMAAWFGPANAACRCQCIDGKAEAKCTSKNDTPPACAASVCPANAPAAAPRQFQVPYAPAEITTTVPPSTTTPESQSPAPYPPSSLPPRARTDSPADIVPAPTTRRATPAQPTQQPLARSTNRPDIPITQPPNSKSLCYERQVFNPNTYEYEWQQSCD
jgi:hypothetical protein